MSGSTRIVPWLAATATIAALTPVPVLAVPPHSSEGECADHVVAQYNKDGDEDGLKFGLQDCNDAYATAEDDGAEEMELHEYAIEKQVIRFYPKTGTLVLLPPYGAQAPQSLSDSSGESAPSKPPRR